MSLGGGPETLKHCKGGGDAGQNAGFFSPEFADGLYGGVYERLGGGVGKGLVFLQGAVD
jgi:hypothetical protein